MSEKMSIRRFAKYVADTNGLDVEETHGFIKELFSLVGQALVEHRSVKFDSFGEFSISDNIDEPIKFVPSSDLSAELNAPFAMFVPTLIEGSADDINLEIPEEESVDDNKEDESLAEENVSLLSNEPEIKTDSVVIDEPDEIPSVVINIIEEAIENIESVQGLTHQQTVIESENEETSFTTTIIEEEDDELVTIDYPQKSKYMSGFIVGLLVGLMIGALALFGYMLYFTSNLTPTV